MEERTAEYKEAVQQNAYEHAARLLLKGDLKDELGPEEIADFARKYFDYHISESQRLRDPEEFRSFVDKEYAGNIAVDQVLTVQRHLENAMSVSRLFGELVSPENKEELSRLLREAAKPLFDLLIRRKKFSDILNWPEMHYVLEELAPEERRRIVTLGLRQYIEEERNMLSRGKLSPRSRAYFSEWANKYGVEDEDILETLTQPEKA